MNQLNSIILEGNLVRDAVLTEPAEGFKVCKFTVAVNRYYKNQKDEGIEEVSYFDVEAYGKIAEYSEKKARKGRGIRVVGRLKQSAWKDESGKSFSKVFVIAEHIEYKPIYQKNDNDSKKEKMNTESSEQVAVNTPPAEVQQKQELSTEEVAF